MEDIVDKDVIEDVRSCIISVPKPRVFGKRSKDLIKTCINRKLIRERQNIIRKPSETSLKKYALPQAKPLRAEKCLKDEILLSFRQFAKQEHRIRHRQRMAIKTREEYRIKSIDLRKRLYIEGPPNDVTALTDIDEDFFNFVNGRPIIHSGSNNGYKFVLQLFNYRLQKKLEVGFRTDTILNIDANYEREQEEYKLCVESCTNQVKCFDRFVSEDYQKSMACLERWEEVKYKVYLKNMELESLASEIFTITSRLVGLDYMYTLQQKYGRFLYYLSPPTWRAQHREFAQSVEIEAKGFDLGEESNEDDSFTQTFDKMKRECAGNIIAPALYFKSSADLIGVFETIEMQQQYQFAHASRMAPLLKLLHIGILNLKDVIASDSAAVASSIEGFEAQIKFYTERSRQLEHKFFKILHGLFYESVGTLDVLKFHVHLGYCYEKVSKEKPINLDITVMAKALESIYLDYEMQLENVQGDQVKKAVQECIKEDKLKLKKAKEAARELRLFKRLEHELQISFAPVIMQNGKITLPSSTEPRQRYPPRNETVNQNKRKHKPKTDKKSLTESEIEYLQLFTDWDENEDPSRYFHNVL